MSSDDVAENNNEKDSLITKSDNNETETKESWWGWVVVMSSFYCIAVLDGVGYTTGVMLDSLRKDLGGGRGQISLVGSLQVTGGYFQQKKKLLKTLNFVLSIVSLFDCIVVHIGNSSDVNIDQ